jgi:hypothetical protein
VVREVILEFQGGVSRFDLNRVSREKLYGSKHRVIVDENGETCVAAALTLDGSALLMPSSTASMYVNGDFDVVERAEARAVDAAGNPLNSVASTLGEEQALRGPVPASRVLDCMTTTVYELDPTELAQALREGLKSGGIYETRFAYRSGYNEGPMFLLENDEGVFALVAEEAPFDWVTRETPASDDRDDPFAEDDSDRAMF